MQKHCQKRNYVQDHINININIILLHGILQITILFDMCAAFALEALHNIFKFDMGAAGRWTRAQGAAAPLALSLSGAAHTLSLPMWVFVC